MLDEKYIAFIKDKVIDLFSNIYIIDVLSDNVYECEINNATLICKNKLSFFDYAEKIKQVIHPDGLKDYFDNITAGNIEKNGKPILFESQIKNEKGEYCKYINYASLLSEGNQLVIVASFKQSYEDKTLENAKELNDRLRQISNRVSEVILKIYNTIDSASDNVNSNKYISVLLNNLVQEFPEFSNQFEKDIKSQVNKTNNTLLVVDDDPMTRKLIQKTFSDDYEMIVATNGKEAIDILEKTGIDNIDGIFLDLLMPISDGFEVLDYLRDKNILAKLPIIIISGTEDKKTRQRVYQYSIADLLEKPFNLEVIKYRTTNLIKLYKTSNALNNIITSQHSDLMKVVDRVIDSYKYDNKKRIDSIKSYLRIILTHVKITYPEYNLNDYSINKILEGFDLYDVGLYAYPKDFNFYKENLTYKDYPKISSVIVSQHFAKYNDKDLFNYANDIALYHNENYDGSGYPFGILGDKIPMCAQCSNLAIYINEAIENGVVTKEGLLNLFNSQKNKFNPKFINILDIIIDNIL